MSHIHKVFGPPGSGKTTYLLNRVEQELADGIQPMQIGYFSFTRKAANEARDRAIAKFPHLNAKTDFPYFRTLHSLAFRCMSVKADMIMQPEHYGEFAAQVGIEINISSEDEVDVAKADTGLAPPVQHVEELIQLGQIGYIRGIEAKLDEIYNDYPEYSGFVTQMRALVDQFDLNQYMNTLQTLYRQEMQ